MTKVVYNVYGQATLIDEYDKKILDRIIKISDLQYLYTLNSLDKQSFYYTTKYFDDESKEKLNILLKDIPNVKYRIQRLMTYGIIEKEYHHKYPTFVFRLKIYSKLYQKHKTLYKKNKIRIEDYSKDTKLTRQSIVASVRRPQYNLENQIKELKNKKERIRKAYIKNGLSIERFHKIYDKLLYPTLLVKK